MNETETHPVVAMVGADAFDWLSRRFSPDTTLRDVPAEILERLARVNVTRRDYASDPDAVTAIALLTFAYTLAGKTQEARHGSNDMMLVKVLSRNELARRRGERDLRNPHWSAPLCELVTGEVGERIRSARFMTNPVQGPA
jgi:hypothetical protein